VKAKLSVLLAAAALFVGCRTADAVPDSFKLESTFDEDYEHRGWKTGFSWDIPQPK